MEFENKTDIIRKVNVLKMLVFLPFLSTLKKHITKYFHTRQIHDIFPISYSDAFQLKSSTLFDITFVL